MVMEKQRHWMRVNGGRVKTSGVNRGGGLGRVVARQGDYIVVEWSRRKHWVANYKSPPRIVVYRMIDDRDDMPQHPGANTENSFRVEECIEWTNPQNWPE